MQESDRVWADKWSVIRFQPRLQDFSSAVQKLSEENKFNLFGTDKEPESSIRNAAFAEAMGEHFRERVSILDYGSGAGRYAQFLRQRLKHFEYFGLEKPGSNFRHGEKNIQAGRNLFRWDWRIKFDMIGSRLEAKEINRVSVVILASIFTHVDFEEMTAILKKFRPIVARGGIVVFSIFIADAYKIEEQEIYGMENCYNRVWYTLEQIQGLCDEFLWQLTEKEWYMAADKNLHRVFAITRLAQGPIIIGDNMPADF